MAEIAKIKDKRLNCPRCSTFFSSVRMRKILHPKGITIDVCDNCHGMWLDGNEVEIMFSKGNDNKIEKQTSTKKRTQKNKNITKKN